MRADARRIVVAIVHEILLQGSVGAVSERRVFDLGRVPGPDDALENGGANFCGD
jgi:hypothetical protein